MNVLPLPRALATSLALAAFAISVSSTAAPTVVHQPYVQQVTSSSAIVVWSTAEPGRAVLRYARPGLAAVSVTATSTLFTAAYTGMAGEFHQHVARLSDLVPAAAYEYDILLDGVDLNGQVDTFTTAPLPGTGTVSFIAFGDSGTGSTAQQQIAARIETESFDFAVHGGDVAYGDASGIGAATHQTTTDWFFNMYSSWLRARPMFPSMGNHDSRLSNGDGRPYLDLFVLPESGGSGGFPDHAERYYSFDYGPLHVVVLDTELAFQDAARRDAQLAWLDADLSATSQPWKVAVFHRSPYSAGGEHGSDLAVRAAFGPVFDRHGVPLVISAHEHVYERTIPVRGGQPDPNGTTYVVSGGGGGPLYSSGAAWWTAHAASVHHYVKAAAADCTLTVQAIGADGAMFDSVTLDRCGGGSTEPAPNAVLGEGDILLYASDAATVVGNWMKQDDASAAGGRAMWNPDRGAPKRTTAVAEPADYFEMTFTATAGVPYRLWMRGKAQADAWFNDSAFVQFSSASDYAIGTTSAATYNLEECSGCGISGWGWQDNGWGAGVLGPTITFTTTGEHRLRVQPREDGLSIDQILLSPQKFLHDRPGAAQNDTTIYPRSGGGAAIWTSHDVGAVGLAGSATENGGTFTVSASGADIWNTSDGMHYVWQQVTGDVDIVARVATVEYVHAWTKAGVMIRESLDAGSPHASMFVTPAKGLAFQRRLTANAESLHTSGGAGTAPMWVKLERRGTTISAYVSADAASWTLVGSEAFALPDTVHVGLAVTSHDNTRLATATFDGVSVAAAALPAPWASHDVGAVAITGSASESGGVFSIQASGDDIWGTADGMHYVWQQVSGDVDIVARVASLEFVHRWTKAGVMIRETLDPRSSHGFMLVSPGKGVAFQRRLVTGGESAHTGGSLSTAPRWVKLERRINTMTAYESADGVTWTLVGSDTFTMGSTVYVGLALTSHDNTRLANASLDNVSVTPR